MSHISHRMGFVASGLFSTVLACSLANPFSTTAVPPTPTGLPAAPIQPGAANPDEPVVVNGIIPFTSPFFINTISEPFVMLEDEAGFVRRDREFQFPLTSQVLGPVEKVDDKTLKFDLALPAVPQGTLVDVDNNGRQDTGVQVFAVAYWSNTWGGPFLERRDGTGWSNAYTSVITDPNRQDEFEGGTLIVWAPDSHQSFPSDYGPDNKLFTSDDPVAPIPAGYNIIDIGKHPFTVTKQARVQLTLEEGVSAVDDLSSMSYSAAFEALFARVSVEYPFTEFKGIDWQALHDQFAPRVAAAKNDTDFYIAMRDFTWAIPDEHIGGLFDNQVFNQQDGGGFGLVLDQLSDGRIIVTQVLKGYAGASAGFKAGAEVVSWNGQPAAQALQAVVPYFGPFSSEQAKHAQQLAFLARTAPGNQVSTTFTNPGGSPQTVNMTADHELDSLFASLPFLQSDPINLPLDVSLLPGSGFAYVNLRTFSDDYNLMARLWQHMIDGLASDQIPALIIDLRNNGGGSEGLALDFAGYFYDQAFELAETRYYNPDTKQFEAQGLPAEVKPGPNLFKGPIAVLLSPDCVSACEGFAASLQHGGRSIVVGHAPTAGAFGEVGRGQYSLPGGLSLQFPTGRPVAPDGSILIEGKGVIPDITVPVTEASALGQQDTVLQAAVDALKAKLGQ
jgi:carboxyl-terminal processing protease